MQIATFNARCPFEIGDKVQEARTGEVRKITDIACIHYLKAGKVEFQYELDHSGQYVPIQLQPAIQNIEISVTFNNQNTGKREE